MIHSLIIGISAAIYLHNGGYRLRQSRAERIDIHLLWSRFLFSALLSLFHT